MNPLPRPGAAAGAGSRGRRGRKSVGVPATDSLGRCRGEHAARESLRQAEAGTGRWSLTLNRWQWAAAKRSDRNPKERKAAASNHMNTSTLLRVGFALLAWAWTTAAQTAPAKRPNILLIMADDLGFSDLGCYGGEIATPNLDALAQGGLRFTQFYNTARCWPSRAALLTGYYAQQVRRDTVPGIPSGTAGTRPEWARLVSERLRPLGYRSYHSGKWHLDGKPLQNGFDHSYSLNDHDRYFAPQLHTEDGVALPAVATNAGYYATTAIADHAIKCLKEHAEQHRDRPFFGFVAFTAPHFPLQAPADDIARYRDRYLAGWDALRAERWRRMQALGIGGSALAAVEREVGPPYAFPEAIAQLGPDEVNRPLAWTELTAAQRRFQADKMAVHAAMVERMDREIGRMLAQLRALGSLEDTLVLFLSDNGASAEMMVRGDGHNPDAECGTGATFLSLGPGWSSLANTPFRRHKTWVHEGGIATPLVVNWPRGIAARGELRRAPGHVVDLVPTILELAGAQPARTTDVASAPPVPGRSLVPLLAQDGSVARDSIWWLHEGNRALRVGDWKLVSAGKDGAWELYDLAHDRSESKNLAAELPEKVRELSERWEKQTQEHSALALRTGPSPDSAWKHSGSVHVDTTPEGANLPASALVRDFPLLVRLDREFLDFSEAQPNGADLRVATATGERLAFQIEEWDAARGTASVWVRVPAIRGNERQEIRLHWGKADAVSESSGAAVFNESNGYLSVWHLNSPVKDEVGTLKTKDEGTTASVGTIGAGRHFAGGQGLFGGEQIAGYPVGSAAHTSEAWLRPEKVNTTALAWGNEQAQGKVVMQFRSPPHINLDCYFSDGNVRSRSRLTNSQWVHVVHTYAKGDSRVYVNGVLDGAATSRATPLAIRSPARLWIGGWYGNYDFVGDMDEVRVSRVARSADWVRLQFENQKPLQTAVGVVMRPGAAFSVTPPHATVREGQSATFVAEAGGAAKVFWTLKAEGREDVVAVDRFQFTLEAGRVTGRKTAVLQFKAVYPTGVKTRDIPITVEEDIPDPAFTLKAPAAWDGRTAIEVVPKVSNLKAMQAKGAGELKTEWNVSPFAVIKEVAPGRLILKRAQNSGQLTVTATISNGGKPVTRSVNLTVKEPKRDAWVARTPARDEQPEEGQFYARDDRNEGTLHCNGTLAEPADSVFLRLFADGSLVKTERKKPGADRSYAFAVKLKPGLIRYRVEFGTTAGGRETVRHTAGNLVCGDAFIIDGQSNALATDTGEKSPPETNEWIRSYGRPSGDPKENVGNLWCNPVWKAEQGERAELGWWGMELAKRLVESQRVPIFIVNGAVGGTRIDQHQRNPANPADLDSIYGRMLWRVRQAKLTHGIRGILWHQGESDQGSDGPTGGFGWETYQQLFVDMAAGWKQDFPNVRHYYVFQIWPDSCSMGGREGSGDRLRERQRTLPQLFSNLSVMSTLGIRPPGGCHFPLVGWAEFARLIQPLIERDHYGKVPVTSITPPNLRRASRVGGVPGTIALEFDQPVVWTEALAGQFYLDGEKGRVVSGRAAGNVLTLTLKGSAAVKQVTYLKEAAWNQELLLLGENGLAALTFCEVPVGP